MLVELSVVEQRYHAVMEVVCGGVPVVEVAERYGVSRKTVHAWLGRYRQEGLPGLIDRSHRPHCHPGQLAAEVEARVCELRRTHPRWGPRRLVHELRRLGADPIMWSQTVVACRVQSRLMLDSEDAASAQPARAGDLLKQQCLSPAAFGWTPLLDRGLMSA
jgi:transposase-like protein